MQFSPYQYLFQLYLLQSLRIVLASVQQLLQLAKTPISPSPPLRYQPETDTPTNFKKLCPHCSPDVETSAFLSKLLPHILQACSEETLAPVNRPLPGLSLGEDRLEDAPPARVFESPTARTRPARAFTPQDGAPTLQHAYCFLAWLIYFCLSAPPRPNTEIVVPASLFRHLFRVSHWLTTAPFRVHADPGLRDFELKGVKPFTTITTTSDLAYEIPNPLSRGSSAQSNLPKSVPQMPGAGALYETYFFPANDSLLGCIEDPKGRPLCIGGYSDVCRCNVRFLTPSEALPAEVAVKVLRFVWLDNRNEADANECTLRRFIQEVITWLSLPKHPNIVPLIGWTLTPNLSFISPWYEQGNLYRHIKDLSDAGRIQVLLGIAKGLECLHSHSPPVVHGDLKPENILMSDGGEPLLADFGLSTILGEERMYTSSHRVGGSVPWMSPEQMIEGSRSCQSDVYSFGSLAFTVMTGEMPYAGLTDGQIALKVCDSKDPKDPIEDWGKYPTLLGPIQALLKDCWSRSPDARPSTTAIVRRLTAVVGWSELM